MVWLTTLFENEQKVSHVQCLTNLFAKNVRVTFCWQTLLHNNKYESLYINYNFRAKINSRDFILRFLTLCTPLQHFRWTLYLTFEDTEDLRLFQVREMKFRFSELLLLSHYCTQHFFPHPFRTSSYQKWGLKSVFKRRPYCHVVPCNLRYLHSPALAAPRF